MDIADPLDELRAQWRADNAALQEARERVDRALQRVHTAERSLRRAQDRLRTAANGPTRPKFRAQDLAHLLRPLFPDNAVVVQEPLNLMSVVTLEVHDSADSATPQVLSRMNLCASPEGELRIMARNGDLTALPDTLDELADLLRTPTADR